jgi:peptidoglycan/LPS O-acetylase OafA/YrhL
VRWRPVAAAATVALFGLGLLNAFALVDAPWARFAAPVPLMFLLPTIDRASIPFLEFFEWLGRRSYGIYLTHFVVINGIVLAVGKWGLRLRSQPLVVYPAFLITTLGLTLLLMEGISRTRPGRRAYRFIFGIVPPPQQARRSA